MPTWLSTDHWNKGDKCQMVHLEEIDSDLGEIPKQAERKLVKILPVDFIKANHLKDVAVETK